MGRSCFTMALVVCAVLILLQFLLPAVTGSARTILAIGEGGDGRGAGDADQGKVLQEERSWREMKELDYVDPGPNVNGKSSYLVPAAPPLD